MSPGMWKAAGPTYIEQNIFDPRVLHVCGLLCDAYCLRLPTVTAHHQVHRSLWLSLSIDKPYFVAAESPAGMEHEHPIRRAHRTRCVKRRDMS